MRPDTLGVIGLGAIGGSVAWQASRAGVPSVVGYDRRPLEASRAVRAGAVHRSERGAAHVARVVDLLVLAAPPDRNLELLESLAGEIRAGGTLVTDVTSVKRPIADLADRLGLEDLFVGSHPFAGTHTRGFEGARPDLLAGAIVYVTPRRPNCPVAAEVADCWARVFAAHVVSVTPDEHDVWLAWSSHLPQAVASVLAATLLRLAPGGLHFGPGACDATRLAMSAESMWVPILLQNRDAVLDGLAGTAAGLTALADALRAGDADGLTQILRDAREFREGWER